MTCSIRQNRSSVCSPVACNTFSEPKNWKSTSRRVLEYWWRFCVTTGALLWGLCAIALLSPCVTTSRFRYAGRGADVRRRLGEWPAPELGPASGRTATRTPTLEFRKDLRPHGGPVHGFDPALSDVSRSASTFFGDLCVLLNAWTADVIGPHPGIVQPMGESSRDGHKKRLRTN